MGVEVGLAGRDRPSHHRRVHVVEVDPPERSCDGEAERGDRGRLGPPAHGRRPDDDGQDALAEDDDREQADPLRDVRGVDRHDPDAHPARERRPQVDRQRERPEPVPVRWGDRGRDEEQRDARRERWDVDVQERSRRREVPPGARVQGDDDPADGRVGERKADGLPVERLWDHGGEHRHQEHAHEHEHPVRRVVRVEAVGVERVADPGPPDGDEETGEDQEAVDARILGQPVRELRDRDDEDEVEEELEPGRVPLVAVVVLNRAQPRRVMPARRSRHCSGRTS